MKSSLLLVASTLLLTACIDGRGSLKVNSPLTLLNKKGKAVSFSPNTFEAKLKFKKKVFSGKKSVTLKVDGKDSVKFNVPKSVKVPRTAGQVILDSEQTGQPVDLHADILTERSSSPTMRETEYCSKRFRYRTCTIVDGKKVIVKKSFTASGRRPVQYHYNYEDTSIEIELLDVQTAELVALFKGTDHDRTKVVDSKGLCRMDPDDMRRVERLRRSGRRCTVVRTNRN